MNTINWIELVQPDKTPIMISISTVQSVGFHANPDAVVIGSTLWEKPLIIQSPNAEKMYVLLKRLLKPKVLEF